MKILMTIALLVSFQAFTAEKSLKPVTTPDRIEKAVDDIYELARGQMDMGGISSIAEFKNTQKMTTFQIVDQIMNDYNLHEMAHNVATNTCEGLREAEAWGRTECVRQVLKHHPYVVSNYGYQNIYSFIKEMRNWVDPEEEAFNFNLMLVEQYAKKKMGPGSKVYSYGYDDQADIFVIIMISKDKKDVLVFTGDYGA